uniref:PepSY domain-containing protein n=1 Tax=Nocardia donostiensis TaxID=1538463 RepID=UPI0009D98E9F|nr:PepSY domain-containing protein [Nocardia donostiensis]
MNRWRRIAVAGIAVGALGLAGCGDDDSEADRTADTPSPATSVVNTSPTSAPTGAAAGDGASTSSAQQAVRTAAGDVPNGRVFDVELETDDGRQVFDIKVASGGDEVKVLVDQPGEQVIRKNQSDRPSDDVAKVETAGIDAERALEVAAEREPEAKLSEMEIDTNRDGVLIWQVELVRADGSDVEIDIDAHSGAVVGTDQG